MNGFRVVQRRNEDGLEYPSFSDGSFFVDFLWSQYQIFPQSIVPFQYSVGLSGAAAPPAGFLGLVSTDYSPLVSVQNVYYYVSSLCYLGITGFSGAGFSVVFQFVGFPVGNVSNTSFFGTALNSVVRLDSLFFQSFGFLHNAALTAGQSFLTLNGYKVVAK